jgi:TolB-like protein
VIYHFGNCGLSIERRELRRDGVLCPIEPQVFDLLHFLIANRERVVTRGEIFDSVWQGRIVSESVLSTRINAARCAIGDNGKEQRLIRTLRRQGLRFVGEVREKRAGLATGAPKLIAAGPRLALSFQDAPTIMVLPFAASEDNAEFADGLTEEVITTLSKLGWLLVISNRSVLTARADSTEVQRLVRQLGSRYLLRGSMRQAGGRARITVHLLDQLSSLHIWSQDYDRVVGDEFDIQDDLVAKIATTICAELYNAEARRAKLKLPESLAAWECVVHALSLMNTRNKAAVGTAYSLMRRAISIDPKCAPAHALLSFATTLGIHMGWQLRNAAGSAALHAARTALDLDTDEPWAHLAHGYAKMFATRQPDEAIEILNHALKLSPHLAIAHYLIALSFSYIGQPERTFAHADLADTFMSYDLLMRGNAGASDNVRATGCWVVGRYREGIEFAQKVIAQSPRQVPAYRALVINSSLAGDVGRSAAVLQKIKRVAPALPRYVSDMDNMYSDRIAYEKYVEGFRMAGLRLS